jgi:glycerol-3-phosphate acyltransferase PlsY
MPEPIGTLLALVSAYLLGSVPFGLFLARGLGGVDIRSVGSGNIGATNVGRVLGLPGFVATLLLDAAKGFAAVRLGPAIQPGPTGSLSLAAGCAAAAVAGHCFPPLLRFRGGKGAATAAGALLAIDAAAVSIAAGVWLVVLAVTRFASVASIAMGLALPVAVVALDPPAAWGTRAPLFALSCALAVFLVVRHRSNLRRLLAGVEPRLGRKTS